MMFGNGPPPPLPPPRRADARDADPAVVWRHERHSSSGEWKTSNLLGKSHHFII
jgi:hypothetical protein